MRISVKRQGRIATARLQGEFDLTAAPKVRDELDALIDAGTRQLVVDLKAVSFLDSSGLGVLLGRYRRLSERGGEVCLVGAQDGVRLVLEMSGVRRLMPLYNSESEVPR